MPRCFDDRPVVGDTGYTDVPRPLMNQITRVVCRDILDPLGAPYVLSWDNTTVTITALADWVTASRHLAKVRHERTLELSAQSDGSLRWVLTTGGESVYLRLAGESASAFLAQRGVARTGDRIRWDMSVPFNLAKALAMLVSTDTELLTSPA